MASTTARAARLSSTTAVPMSSVSRENCTALILIGLNWAVPHEAEIIDVFGGLNGLDGTQSALPLIAEHAQVAWRHDDDILQVGEEVFSFFVGETAAHAPDHLKGTIRAQHCDQHVVQHADAIVGSFGKPDHCDVQRVARLDLEDARGVTAGDEAF